VCLDKQRPSSDDAECRQPPMSASALLKDHEKTMMATKDKTHLLETSSRGHKDHEKTVMATKDKTHLLETSSRGDKDNDMCTSTLRENAQSASSNDVPSRTAECVSEPQPPTDSESSQSLKSACHVPELGRGLNGFIDLDDVPCCSRPLSVTADSAKVFVGIVVDVFKCMS